MRRWNGWGDEANDFPLKKDGALFLQNKLGKATRLTDATLGQVIAKVPASRLPEHPLISTDPELRVRHARGQSFHDWLNVRSGQIDHFPDGVAQPENSQQVRELIDFCGANDIDVVPYGGGTSVAGHINVVSQTKPTLTISLAKLNQLIGLDEQSQIATIGAGAPGPLVEELLAEHGYRLGHFPQSFELSTIGGWVVTRSSGQQSLLYGRIEQLFAGGKLETPQGTLDIPTFPASAAGPDLRELVMGSEGRLGIITEVKVRISKLPQHESFHGAFFPSWDAGIDAVRELVRTKAGLSMIRLSDEIETESHLTLSGHKNAAKFLNGYLRLRGLKSEGKCMLTYGVSSSDLQAKFALKLTHQIIKQHGGVNVGTQLGKRWEPTRFRAPYIRHGMWENGYAVDTFETCADWNKVNNLKQNVEAALAKVAAEFGEKVHFFTHLSHIYSQGSSIYTSYVFRCGDDYAETMERWRKFKAAASEAIVASGGTISHHHGVGYDHAPYLSAEKGVLGMRALTDLLATFDPQGIMNPGKLLPEVVSQRADSDSN